MLPIPEVERHRSFQLQDDAAELPGAGLLNPSTCMERCAVLTRIRRMNWKSEGEVDGRRHISSVSLVALVYPAAGNGKANSVCEKDARDVDADALLICALVSECNKFRSNKKAEV